VLNAVAQFQLIFSSQYLVALLLPPSFVTNLRNVIPFTRCAVVTGKPV